MNLRFLLACALLALAVACSSSARRPASSLSESDRSALESYEKIRAALAQDDGRSAKLAAKQLAESLKDAPASQKSKAFAAPAQQIAEAATLDRQRDGFKELSAIAVAIAGDVSGFYVVTCPVTAGGIWLQTSTQIDNPYLGRVMHDAGTIKR